MIEVKDLVKSYGGNTVVDHLSFTVESGQIYGFLGPNGAGKTTTMNILTGYIGMTSGSVTVNGHDLTEEPDEVRRCIGYLPEQPPLYPDMTPREYLEFAAELKKLPKAQRRDAVQQVMDMTKITHMQNRLIKNLSKGYRQRVGLAQAILGMPEVIILDEPTVGLDPKQIIDIRELIKSLAGEHTVILSSHILSEVQEICDHILIIHHGKFIASGTPQELERQVRGSSVDLTLKCDSFDAAQSVLSAVPGIAQVQPVSSSGGETKLAVSPAAPEDDLREDIFRACAAYGVPILEMRYSGMDLERVFLDLTSDIGISLSGGDESADAPDSDTGNSDDSNSDNNTVTEGGEEI